MSFSNWKRSYQKDRICRSNRSLTRWLYNHKVRNISELLNQSWICTETEGKVVLKTWKIEMTVVDMPKVYKKVIYSLDSPANIVHDIYFSIYGNLCQIMDLYTRVLEYPRQKYTIRRGTIFAKVKPLWREERASHTIDRFLWNCCHTAIKIPKLAKSEASFKASRMESCLYEELKRWYTDEFHQRVIEYFIGDHPINIQTPRLVLIFGLPGSGKNWVLEKKREKNHVHINVDDIRALLPKYWKGIISVQPGNLDWISFMSQECNSIAIKIFNQSLSQRMNIVWNGTGKNADKYEKLLSQAKDVGYVTELRYVWVPLEVARKRVRRRSRDIGREVPDEVIQKASRNIPKVFKNLRIKADHARIFENQERSPTMIWDKKQGWNCTPKRRKSISL